jgi:hypothetical protein
MKSPLLKALLCLGSFLATLPLQAQVVYAPVLPSMDTLDTGPNGGTVTIRYELQGSPAGSPYGEFFYLTYEIGPIMGRDPGLSPVTYDSIFQLSPSAYPVTMHFNTTNLQAGDMVHFDDPAGIGRVASIEAGILIPNYTFDIKASIPDIPTGWEMGPEGPFSNFAIDNIVSFGGQQGVGGSGDTWSHFAHVLDGTNVVSTLPIGETGTVGLFYTYTGDPAVAAGYYSGVSPGALATFNMRVGNLTFNQVPEPGSAMLVLAGSGLFLLRRPSRLRTRTETQTPVG